MLGSWPSITFGGCRFLLQCRQWFLVQVRVLARAKVRWTDGRVLELPEVENLEYSRFGLSTEDIGEQFWTQPVIGALSMVRPPGIRIKLLEFDVSSTKPCEIGRKCTMLGRSQRWSLLEWVRLNPGLLRTFFVRTMFYKDGSPCVNMTERFWSTPDPSYCVRTEVSRSRFLRTCL